MMPPPDLVLEPALILAMWAGGMAIGAAFVGAWQIVGRGFFWVTATAIIMVGAWLVPGQPAVAGLAVALILVAAATTTRPRIMAGAFGLGGVAFLVPAAGNAGWLLTVTGAVVLGGVTDEMLLGHWYLVDPRLPRWALKRLDIAAVVALVGDGIALVAAGGLTEIGVVSWAWLALLGLSILLMVGVWFSIREQGYAGVMAATGLSYLAVLTALGATVTGRALIGQVATQLGRVGI